MLDIRNFDLSDSMCVIGDILKTSGPKNHIGKIKFHVYPTDLTACQLNCLRQCLEATKQHGQHYFVIHNSGQTIQGTIEGYISKMGKTNTQKCWY